MWREDEKWKRKGWREERCGEVEKEELDTESGKGRE